MIKKVTIPYGDSHVTLIIDDSPDRSTPMFIQRYLRAIRPGTPAVILTPNPNRPDGENILPPKD